ncbi:gamma-glutamyltransferase [Variovorax sp. E3]|uniref:gamma-glutamyltransferase n=1 Tax=Variovorax sp. E3 TaxID=1914993 RepID=UPI0018DD9360|nr:gamma-glutamyltransferase [Variovorax sp. E3]
MTTTSSAQARAFTSIAALSCCALMATACGGGNGPASGGLGNSKSSAVPQEWTTGKAYRDGVVTAQNPYAAEAGARLLEEGGNAVDAAVAVAYALNVVEPHMAGIGGGGFMMIHTAETGKTIAIDSREKAPGGATRDMFVGVGNPTQQGVAVGVPGMVRGTAMAVEKYGKLTLAQTIQPAIELAEKGFAATPLWARSSCGERALNSPETAAYFCSGGRAAQAGEIVRNQPLAETFKLIAKNGPDCFYRVRPGTDCDIARGVVEGQTFSKGPRGKGGSMTLADLEAYQPVERTPVEGSYRGWKMKIMAPPSSGGLTVLQILGLLERFPIGDKSAGFGFGTPKTLNVMADALRVAFADRRDWIGDSDFVSVPVKGLVNKTYLSSRSSLIQPGIRLNPDPSSSDPRPYETAGLQPQAKLKVALAADGNEKGTTHFSVVDKWGNMVSYTNTVEAAYGIGVFAGYRLPNGDFKSFGFVLNNELTDFNITPTTHPYLDGVGANDVQPNKRPRSSMSPAMLFTPEGKPVLAYGSPGGPTIINSVVNVTLNLIDHRMGLQEAINAPRISATGVAASVTMEPGFPSASVDAMKSLGYTVTSDSVGAVQAVLVAPDTGKQYGGADLRYEGTIVGLPRRQ